MNPHPYFTAPHKPLAKCLGCGKYKFEHQAKTLACPWPLTGAAELVPDADRWRLDSKWRPDSFKALPVNPDHEAQILALEMKGWQRHLPAGWFPHHPGLYEETAVPFTSAATSTMWRRVGGVKVQCLGCGRMREQGETCRCKLRR